MPVISAPTAPRSLLEMMVRAASRTPGEVLYTFLKDGESEGARLTCGELDRRARALGAELQARGLAGERALLLFPPGLDFIAAFFGCASAGVVAVPAYPPRAHRTDSRLAALLADAAPRAVLTTPALRARQEALAALHPELRDLTWIVPDEIDSARAADWRDPGIGPEDLAFLQYTSGSTAAPRGVEVSHGNLLHNEEMMRQAFRTSESSVVVGWLPLYHDMGLIGNVLQPLYVGAHCVLMSPLAFLQRPGRWLRAIHRYRATTSGGPNFAYELCLRKIGPEEREGLDLSCWDVAFSGAEPVRADTLDRFAAAFAPHGFRRSSLYPCYGLAEATLFVTGGAACAGPCIEAFVPAALESHRAEPARAEGPRRELVGCGRTWLGQEIAIVDPETGERCAPGRTGEIWIAGPSVAHGYFRQPEATARDFRAVPAGEPAAGPFLRTGDLGFLHEGELFVTGRLKDLILLRGRNCYPQDVERTAERTSPAVRPGGIAAFGIERNREERLVVVAEIDLHSGLAPAEIAEAVRRAVAEEHEAQVEEVVLIRAGAMPRTSSGKVQRQACRAAYLEGRLDAVARSLPATGDAEAETGDARQRDELLDLASPDLERRLVDWVRQAAARTARVPLERLPPDEPLSRVLDSLGAVELRSRIQAQLGVEVSLSRLLEGSDALGMAREIRERLERSEVLAALSPAPDGEAPLSFGQQALWFLHQLAPASGAYHLAAAARCLEPVSLPALRRALDALVVRHPQLRTTFHESPGGPRQRATPDLRPELVDVDVAELSAAGCMDAALAEAYRPFDLSAGPLLRVALLRGAPGGDLLVWAIHHIIADFWSVALLARELGALYGEAVGAPPADLDPPAAAYTDFVHWQAERMAGAEGERLWSFWRNRLAGAPLDLDLPTDRSRPAQRSWRGASAGAVLDARLAASAEALAQSQGGTLFMLLLAVFQALLSRHTGQEDLLIGSPTAGRERAELAGVVGYFVNPVALRGDLAGGASFIELMERTRRTVLEAFAHQELPFPLLTERLRPDRVAASMPVVQATLSLQKAQRPEEQSLTAFALGLAGVRSRLGPLHLESAPLPERFSPFDLVLRAARLPGGLALSLQYDTDMFDATTAERLLGHFSNLLAAAVADPRRRAADLPALTAAERSQVTVEWPDARRPYPRESGLAELFDERVRQAPEAVALEQVGLQVTWAELARRSMHLAGRLRALGVGPETRVGLFLDRSVDLVVAILAVVRAGGTYVPLDASHPRERLELLLDDSGTEVLIAGERLAALLPQGNRRILTPRLHGDAPREGAAAGAWARPDTLAYIMYTSGSTGRPKGVAIPQRGIVRLVRGAEYCDLGPDQVFLQHAPASFDASTLEIWAPLLNGGRLVLAPPGNLSLDELVSLLERHGVSTLWLTTSQFHQIADGHLAALRSVRQIVAGGDVVLPEAFRRTLSALPGLSLIHVYGPTESTTFTSSHRLRSAAEVTVPVPIGRPISNTTIYLLDDAMRPVPVGAPGELYVGGDGLARGYVGRPELTAERFVPDPYGVEPGARLYRTGDRTRWRPDGLVDFLGRLDGQVKIRGFRVEPGEIEAVLRAVPGVEQAAVVVQGGPGDRRLVAWVAAPHGGVEAAELRAVLRRRLPEFMVPSAIGIQPALPLGPTGKLDWRALAQREPLREATGEAPRTPLEELLGEIFADVLGVPAVGRDDSFFDLGGHSLLATRVISRLQEAVGCALRLQELFEQPTVAGLARIVETRRGGLALPPLAPAGRRRPLPASPAQERLWVLEKLQPGDPTYHVPAAIHLAGALSVPALHAALSGVVARHEALRTRFAEADGAPVQVVEPPETTPLPVIDLSALPAAERRSAAGRLSLAEARRAFDLEAGPLLRTLLLDLGGGEHELLLVVHHIVFDGWSLALFVRELGILYAACCGGAAPSLPVLPVQPADHAVWQRRWLAAGARETLGRFWEEEMRGALPEINLPADRPRRTDGGRPGRKCEVALSIPLTAELRRLGRRSSGTLFMTLLAGFAALSYRWTGERDLTVGTPVAGRDHRDIEDLVGFFVNTVAMRVRPGGAQTFSGLLAQVRTVALRALDHQGLPFADLVERLQPDRDALRNPLFNVMFILQTVPPPQLELPGLTVEGREVANGVAKFDLTLILEEREGELACVFDHDAGRFDATTMQRLAGAYARLLAGAAAGEERPVRDLPLLSEAERHQLQIELDAPAANPPELLHELLAGFARRHPEVEAVSYAGQTRSYGELAEAVARLAHALRRAGVDVGTTVGLLFPTGPALIEALFAAMAAGAAFTVVDPGQPPARTESILRAARPAVLLGDGPAMAAALPLLRDLRNDLRLLLVCRGEAPPELAAEPGIAVWDEAALACFPVRLPATGAGPDDPAYLVFTSGSTGTPKGILQPHRSFVQYLHWQAQRCDFGAPARVAQWAASTYDASYCEIFGALCFGGTLVMAPPERRYDPAAALEWLEGERVTLFQTVPSFCRHFIDALDAAAAVRPHPPLRRLRWMLLAGEPLPVDLAAAWRERCPGARLVNLYGPTECVLATFHEVGEADLRRRTVPIGRAIDGRHILILDADGGLSPLGAKGELWIRSSYLTCGYPGRPAETAAAFVPDPAGGEPGARCYRTGDVARFRVDGVLEFFGRRDFQVKIGGVRVEVEEVEAVLRSREEIRACAVVARELARGDLRLVAYIVASGEPDLPALSAWLAQRLPSAMVPAAWVLMPELPRNANGKLDRSRLPGPDLSARSTGATYAAPRTPTEAELAAIFSELLQVERVGIQDSFFAAGGHSLLATRALARIRAKYGVALPLRTFFASPTVAALAVAIAEQRAAALDTDQMSHLLARLEGLSEDEARRLLCEGP